MRQRLVLAVSSWTVLLFVSACSSSPDGGARDPARAQVDAWSGKDLEFFLHGSMSTEIVPERVLRALVLTYPDLFPSADLRHLGAIPDADFGWPVGFSRREVGHFAGMSSIGINCAACHVAEVDFGDGTAPVRVIGATAHFDAEAFFGALLASSFRTSDPANLQRYTAAWLKTATAPQRSGPEIDARVAAAFARHGERVGQQLVADPFGAEGIAPGALHELDPRDFELDRAALEREADLLRFLRATVRLFHNLRAALHVPDAPPEALPPPSGPGRNDAFGLLSAALLGRPLPWAPVKYGLMWNLAERRWVHWDGNTRSPIGRNLLAALGLGAPLLDRKGLVDFGRVRRHTELTERVTAPRYPRAIDRALAARGSVHYREHCAECHDGVEDDRRLHALADIGTDPRRAELFTQAQADGFNRFLAELEVDNYRPASEPGLRSTQRYWAPSLAGAWARSPYLHNGSVRTLAELLLPPAQRSKSFRRGSRAFDADAVGYVDAGSYLLDTTLPGNGNGGHDYGTRLSPAERAELIEYLKTL